MSARVGLFSILLLLAVANVAPAGSMLNATSSTDSGGVTMWTPITSTTNSPPTVTTTTTATIASTYYSAYTNGYPPECYPYGCYPYSYTYGYGYPYPYQYPYQYATTVTVTNYSLLTETSITTSATTSIPNPVFITNTLTSTAVTTDTTLEAVLGTLMMVFLALFLATLFLLVRPRRTTNNPQPVQQAYIATSYRCSACGTDVGPNAKFCGNCGVPLRS